MLHEKEIVMCLKIKHVKKSYGDKTVLDDINLELDSGLYGFLGANGVGKSTLFKIISRYITDYTGTVVYPKKNRNAAVEIGFLPQNFGGYPDMKVDEFLLYLGSIKSNASPKTILRDIDEKVELFNLTEFRQKKLKKLSGGQLRRVGLAQAFQLNPKIILLDEPTTGLDPTERIKFKNYLTEIGREQIILLSTHIVTDLEIIAKKIFILKDHNFVMTGSEKDLINQCFGMVWEAEFQSEIDLHKIASNRTISMVYSVGTKTKARVISDTPPTPTAVKVIPTLNDVYLINFEKEAGFHAI